MTGQGGMDRELAVHMARWKLAPDGEAIVTGNSCVLPVRQNNVPAMLKLALSAEERDGAALMCWWRGEGAARVLAHHGDALLLERALGRRSLAAMSREGDDDAACHMLCDAVAQLHTARDRPPPEVVPLERWFAALHGAGARYGGVFAKAAAVADALLQTPREQVVLHGDIHHDNVLDFGERGWLAIDPKGLGGERGFEYANLFCNPDAATALAPGRFQQRVRLVSELAGIEPHRLLQWVLAWTGLSATWLLEDGYDAAHVLELAGLADSMLVHD